MRSKYSIKSNKWEKVPKTGPVYSTGQEGGKGAMGKCDSCGEPNNGKDNYCDACLEETN